MILMGVDQLEPFQERAYPLLSTATQKEPVVHDTALMILAPSSWAAVQLDVDVGFVLVSRRPALSTAAQNDDVGHETPVERIARVDGRRVRRPARGRVAQHISGVVHGDAGRRTRARHAVDGLAVDGRGGHRPARPVVDGVVAALVDGHAERGRRARHGVEGPGGVGGGRLRPRGSLEVSRSPVLPTAAQNEALAQETALMDFVPSMLDAADQVRPCVVAVAASRPSPV